METCFNCGNCHENVSTYYCTVKNDFVIKDASPTEKIRNGGWKKGDLSYETRRRSVKGGEEVKKTG